MDIAALAQEKPCYEYRRIWALLQRKCLVNCKGVHRLWKREASSQTYHWHRLHGPEFVAVAIQTWLSKRRIQILSLFRQTGLVLAYLERRWKEGCQNKTQLWHEIQAQGYQGSRSSIYRALKGFRANQGPWTASPKVARPKQRALSPRQAIRLQWDLFECPSCAGTLAVIEAPSQFTISKPTQSTTVISTESGLAAVAPA